MGVPKSKGVYFWVDAIDVDAVDVKDGRKRKWEVKSSSPSLDAKTEPPSSPDAKTVESEPELLLVAFGGGGQTKEEGKAAAAPSKNASPRGPAAQHLRTHPLRRGLNRCVDRHHHCRKSRLVGNGARDC